METEPDPLPAPDVTECNQNSTPDPLPAPDVTEFNQNSTPDPLPAPDVTECNQNSTPDPLPAPAVTECNRILCPRAQLGSVSGKFFLLFAYRCVLASLRAGLSVRRYVGPRFSLRPKPIFELSADCPIIQPVQLVQLFQLSSLSSLSLVIAVIRFDTPINPIISIQMRIYINQS